LHCRHCTPFRCTPRLFTTPAAACSDVLRTCTARVFNVRAHGCARFWTHFASCRTTHLFTTRPLWTAPHHTMVSRVSHLHTYAGSHTLFYCRFTRFTPATFALFSCTVSLTFTVCVYTAHLVCMLRAFSCSSRFGFARTQFCSAPTCGHTHSLRFHTPNFAVMHTHFTAHTHTCLVCTRFAPPYVTHTYRFAFLPAHNAHAVVDLDYVGSFSAFSDFTRGFTTRLGLFTCLYYGFVSFCGCIFTLPALYAAGFTLLRSLRTHTHTVCTAFYTRLSRSFSRIPHTARTPFTHVHTFPPRSFLVISHTRTTLFTTTLVFYVAVSHTV